MGILDKASTFRGLGRTPEKEMVWPKKSALVVPMIDLGGDSFKSCVRSRDKWRTTKQRAEPEWSHI